MLLRPVEDHLYRLVEAQRLGDDAGGVELVSGMIDAAALEHEKERSVASRQAVERQAREHRERRVAAAPRVVSRSSRS